MGCFNTKPVPSKNCEILKKIIDCIIRDDVSMIKSLVSSFSSQNSQEVAVTLSQRLIRIGKFHFDFLTYCLYRGSANCFQYFFKTMQVPFKTLEKTLEKEQLSGLYLICKYGYLGVLKLYLPEYLNHIQGKTNKNDQSYTLDFVFSLKTVDSWYTPLQLACGLGNLSIVIYVAEYFADKKPPSELDIHYIDELTGENCALISARIGNISMMRLLFEQFNADFFVKNKRNEGALQILAAASKNHFSNGYFECIVYLVETIKIDISYMYEEVLLLIDNPEAVKYFEKKLKENEILTTKIEVESFYAIKFYPHPRKEAKDDSFETSELSRIVPLSVETPFYIEEDFLKNLA